MDVQYVVFKIHTEEYGIEIGNVLEIVQMQEITKIPQSVDLIEGIINLRGQIIPIVDLKKRFYNLRTDVKDSSRIIVVNAGDQVVGIIADEVSEVLRLGAEMIEAPPVLVKESSAGSGIKGVGKLENRLLILLDLTGAFNTNEISLLKEAIS